MTHAKVLEWSNFLSGRQIKLNVFEGVVVKSPLLAGLADALHHLGPRPSPRASEPFHGVVGRWAGETVVEG